MAKSNNHLIIIDKSGARLTTYVLGIHREKMSELLTLAAVEYPGADYIEDDGTIQRQMLAGNVVYKGGKVVPAPEPEPTPEELKAQARAEYEATVAEFEKEARAALLRGDDAALKAIQEDYKEFQAAYSDEL